MAVVVTMEVGPVDWTKFQSATEWMNSQPTPGLRSNKVYRSEANSNIVLIMQEWDSHEAFHAASDKVGDEFNRRAGTEGLDWRTGVWAT
jgi:heme-degrading monooxygenase HmoA